jgi:hypothetical protein
MKNKFLIGIGTAAVAILSAVSVDIALQNNDLSALSLANVEALAQEKTDTGGCKWKNIQCPFPKSNLGYGICITNGDGVSCDCGATTHDPLPC